MSRTTAKKLVSNSDLISAIEVYSKGPRTPYPALFTRTSMAPCSSMIRGNAPSTPSSEFMSSSADATAIPSFAPLLWTHPPRAMAPPGPSPDGEAFLPEFPEINVLSNVVEDGRPIGGLGAGEAVWHADMTYIETPPKASVLHALEIPESGGDTYFANMFAAYEALADALKEAIDGRTAIHDAAPNRPG